MPQTDHLSLASQDTRDQFESLFQFAWQRGVASSGDRDHFAQRFAADPDGTRRDIEMRVAGTITAAHGAIAAPEDVRQLVDYPKAKQPADPTAYIKS